MSEHELAGKVAIVTGAGRNIGRAIALKLARSGAALVVNARANAVEANGVVREIEASGGRAVSVIGDVADAKVADALAAAALKQFGRIDILVNNAGGWLPRPMMETSEKAFDAAHRFNVTAPFVLIKLAVPVMIAHDGGAIVNISSRAASMVQQGFTAYGTAKAGVSFLTRLAAPELAPKIRINAIEVGGVQTAALEMVLSDDSVRRELEDNTPLRRVGQVEDIAACVVYLASPAASWVTGKIFEVDGGVEHPAFTIPVEPL
jgi:7-alpha-hydroxysteroid dehydrogenase